jgi:hypothetical protein
LPQIVPRDDPQWFPKQQIKDHFQESWLSEQYKPPTWLTIVFLFQQKLLEYEARAVALATEAANPT